MDLLIHGGTVIDGTGAPGYAADVAVADRRIRVLARRPDARQPGAGAGVSAEPIGRRIDATGRVVAPGFIDLHSHGGLTILGAPLHEPKVRQGVTTEIVGVDGLSPAPFRDPADLAAHIRMNAGLDGRPPEDADGRTTADWRTIADYLARLDRRVSVNVGIMAGNTALRINALGWDDIPADASAMDRMAGDLDEAMADGAFGVSSGLDYPPGAYATTEELAALTNVAARRGGIYHTHVRYPLGDRYLDPFREAIEIGRRGEGPAHITHFYHRETFPDGPERLLALVDDARAAGQDVTFDTYPSEWASSRLLVLLPIWVQEGGPDRTLERLADRSARERIRDDLHARGVLFAGPRGLDDVGLGAFRRPENLHWEGRTLGDVVASQGRDPVDIVCDLLIEEDLGINEVTPGPWSETLHPFVSHPAGMIGSDSCFLGDRPSPRTYGSFPRILGQFVRDEARLTLEEAIRKMTGAAAARLGLADRGVIRDDAVADIVVFDPATVRSTATRARPRSYPDGIDYVIIDGTVVVDLGGHTGATPGIGLRHGRA
jgi:N-acyl-D-amino-acid deacylase